MLPVRCVVFRTLMCVCVQVLLRSFLYSTHTRLIVATARIFLVYDIALTSRDGSWPSQRGVCAGKRGNPRAQGRCAH